MEWLLPIAIVAIGIGLLFFFFRRPRVVRPPTTTTSAKTDAPRAAPRSDDAMQEILSELTADMSSGGTKRVKILKGKGEIGWMVAKRLDQTSRSPGDLRGLIGKGSMEQLARELLAKVEPGSVPGNAPPEAVLQYPGSSLVADSFETKRTSDGSVESRDVYKTTLATEADSAQVLAWYRD